MTIEEAIKLCEEGSKSTWNGRQTTNGEIWQQMAAWLNELKAHREAWKKVEVEIDKRIFEPWENHICDNYFDGLYTAREIAKNLKPKEGDAE